MRNRSNPTIDKKSISNQEVEAEQNAESAESSLEFGENAAETVRHDEFFAPHREPPPDDPMQTVAGTPNPQVMALLATQMDQENRRNRRFEVVDRHLPVAFLKAGRGYLSREELRRLLVDLIEVL